MKKLVVILVLAFGVTLIPGVFAATAGTSSAVDNVCLRKAVSTYQVTIKTVFNKFATDMANALTKRASSLDACYAGTSVQTCVPAAWKVYDTAKKAAYSAYTKSVTAASLAYAKGRKACGAGTDSGPAGVDASL